MDKIGQPVDFTTYKCDEKFSSEKIDAKWLDFEKADFLHNVTLTFENIYFNITTNKALKPAGKYLVQSKLIFLRV